MIAYYVICRLRLSLTITIISSVFFLNGSGGLVVVVARSLDTRQTVSTGGVDWCRNRLSTRQLLIYVLLE
jgi:hypothetical protein